MEGAAEPPRKPRRACARGLSQARRRQLDEAHARLDRSRQADGGDRLPACAHLYDEQRHRLHRAEGAGVLRAAGPRIFREWISLYGPTDSPRKLARQAGQDLAEARQREADDGVPHLSLEPGRRRQSAHRHLFHRPRRLRPDGSRRAHLDQIQDRFDPDLPPLLPRGRVRLLRDEHRRAPTRSPARAASTKFPRR